MVFVGERRRSGLSWVRSSERRRQSEQLRIARRRAEEEGADMVLSASGDRRLHGCDPQRAAASNQNMEGIGPDRPTSR